MIITLSGRAAFKSVLMGQHIVVVAVWLGGDCIVPTSAVAECISLGTCSRFSESTGLLGLCHCSSFHHAETVVELTWSHSLSGCSKMLSSDLTRYHQCSQLLAIRRDFRWIATFCFQLRYATLGFGNSENRDGLLITSESSD